MNLSMGIQSSKSARRRKDLAERCSRLPFNSLKLMKRYVIDYSFIYHVANNSASRLGEFINATRRKISSLLVIIKQILSRFQVKLNCRNFGGEISYCGTKKKKPRKTNEIHSIGVGTLQLTHVQKILSKKRESWRLSNASLDLTFK